MGSGTGSRRVVEIEHPGGTEKIEHGGFQYFSQFQARTRTALNEEGKRVAGGLGRRKVEDGRQHQRMPQRRNGQELGDAQDNT